jgi:hypothetical protein
MSSQFSTFPSTHSIPPASFYNIQGLNLWLNQNPSYKDYFVKYPTLFPGLSPMTSTLSSMNYNVQNVPIPPLVTTLSYNQAQQYNSQLQLFSRVYAFNSNAYLNSLDTGSGPAYYSFSSYQELMTYKSSVAFVNKLYPFDAMARGTNEQGQQLGWIVPFPL